MSRYTIAQGPTKWTTALEKIYAKQSEQLNRHHEQLRERDRQMVEKAKNESLANTFGALAQFSSTVGAAVQAGKKRHETWKEKYKLGLSTSKEWLQHSETIDKIRKLRYKEEKEKVSHQPEIDKLVTLLRKDGKNSTAFDLLNVSGRRLVAQNELLAQNAAAGHTVASMRKFYSDKGLEDKVNEIDTNNNNPDYIRGMLYEYQHDRLAHLNLNDDAIAGILGGELKRQRDTAGGTAKAKANAAVSDKDDLRILTQIETANRVGTLEESIWSVRESLVNEGKFQEYVGADGKTVTVNQQVDAYLFETLNDLSQDGLINTSQLQPYIDSGFRHPAGKGGESTPGEILFTKEQVNQLVKSTRFGEGRYISVRTELDKKIYKQAELLRLQGKIEEADELMRPVIGRDLLTQEEFADYDRINPIEQSKSYETERDGYYTDLESKGKLPSIEELNREPNRAMRDKWVKIKKDKEKWKSDNKHSYNTDLFKNEVYKLRTTRSLEPGQPISQEDGAVVQKLVDFSEMRLAYYLGQDRINGTTTPNIAALIKQDVDAFKVGNGWGTQEGGMFSLDKSGGEHKWANINQVDIDLGSQGQYFHDKPSPNIEQSYNAKLLEYPNISKTDRHKLPGAIFSNRQMLGFKENMYFSEDMKYIASREGLTLDEAFSLALKSMDSDFAKLHNFKQLPEEAKANLKTHSFIAETLDKGIETLLQLPEESRDMRVLAPAIRDLKYKLKYQGWDSFTPKDKEMLIKIGSFVIPDDIKEKAEQDTRDAIRTATPERRGRSLNTIE